MTKQYFTADFFYTHNQLLHDVALVVEAGIIQSIVPLAQLTPEQTQQLVTFRDAAIIPGLVNTHTHSFQSLLKGLCDDADFFTWRDQALYRYARKLTPEDLYHGALFAFAEMLKTGVTTVCDFFYIHDQANENAQHIIRAAQDLGMRMVMARTMYDWDGAPDRFIESVDTAIRNTDALIQQYKTNPMVSVLPAPHSLHGASLALIQAGASLAEQHNTLWHMHIAEGEYERNMMLEKHGHSPIAYLHQHQLLSQRLVGIHCVWLDDADINLMAQTGSRLSYNPSSNMFLGDGITRIREMQDAGICMSLGTDGGCSNNRASIIEEMRMASLLQKVRWCNATQFTAEEAFLMGTQNGGLNLNLPIGRLEPNYVADFTVVDLNDLSMQPQPHRGFGKNLIYASQPSAIQAVYVAGQCMMQNGQCLRQSDQDIVKRVQQTWERLNTV